jgi:hypothetical protein
MTTTGKPLVMLTLTTAVAAVITLTSAEAVPPGHDYRTFPSCHVQGAQASDPDRWCSKHDHFGAVLVSRFRNGPYRLCFQRPDGKRRCVHKRAHGAPPNPHPSTVALYLRAGRHAVGTWRLKWLNYKHSHVVIGRAKLHVRR